MIDDATVTHHGNMSLMHSSVGVYMFSIASTTKVAQPSVLPFDTTRALEPLRVGPFKIVPHGPDNTLPEEIRSIMDENNLMPQILTKNKQLLWGQGPETYTVDYQDGKRVKKWAEHKQVKDFLKSFNYESYLDKASEDYVYMNGHYTRKYRNRAPRIGGAGKIVHLEHVASRKCRLEWPDENDKIHAIITGNWIEPWKNGLTREPIWNYSDPFRDPVTMNYSNCYSFALDNDYSRPSFFGSLNWIKLSSSIAKVLLNYNENSAAIKWHIKVPSEYWEEKKRKLEKKCIIDKTPYLDSMLDDLKTAEFKKFADALAGVANVGKFVTTDKFYDPNSKTWEGWSVEPLDQKVKDFIDAQINISKRAALETTSGAGMHPALSNISSDGNLPSGSEQLYAFKLFLLTGVEIPESIICRDINEAININFPGTGIKVGFYHDTVLTEEATPPKDRVKNKAGNQVQAMATCGKCGCVFDYLTEPEAGMGYVNCPNCQHAVTQDKIASIHKLT